MYWKIKIEIITILGIDIVKILTLESFKSKNQIKGNKKNKNKKKISSI